MYYQEPKLCDPVSSLETLGKLRVTGCRSGTCPLSSPGFAVRTACCLNIQEKKGLLHPMDLNFPRCHQQQGLNELRTHQGQIPGHCPFSMTFCDAKYCSNGTHTSKGCSTTSSVISPSERNKNSEYPTKVRALVFIFASWYVNTTVVHRTNGR